MGKPSLFVFVDDEHSSCVIVSNCSEDRAKVMLGRAIQHVSTPPLKFYNADEYAAAFVAANKSRPFDMLFVGPYDDVEGDLDGVGTIYEIARRDNKLLVLPVDTNGEVAKQVWEYHSQTLH